MNDNLKYIEWKKKRNLIRQEIPNVEDYFIHLNNIEDSFTGRTDALLANTFIMESIQLIINSISLFELGYFDSAYYSLREAIELSTTIVYLSDMPYKDRQEKMEDWKNTKYFPVQKKMLNQLYQHGEVVSDMKSKMKNFFDSIENISEQINKYVHKQGLRFFYVSRNHQISIKKDDNVFIQNYVYFLEKTIGIVAVMRLAIDPFPVLLMEEDILLRCFDSLTEAYSIKFVEKYIGQDTLKDYQKTDIYINYYNHFIKEEKKNCAVFDVMKYNFIDTAKSKDILSQIYLLNYMDKIAIYIALSSKKVVRIYTSNCILIYFTDRKSNRKEDSWDGSEIKQFTKNNKKFNQNYGEAFISVFKYNVDENDDEIYIVEHNVPLDDREIEQISGIVVKNK